MRDGKCSRKTTATKYFTQDDYKNCYIKVVSKSKLIKMAIDNLVNEIEGLPEEEALSYLRNLYKEAEF